VSAPDQIISVNIRATSVDHRDRAGRVEVDKLSDSGDRREKPDANL
jgi:hypothetical protein